MKPFPPMPDRIVGLPRDKRGFPIPWVVFRDEAGRPHFTINDFGRIAHCIVRNVCPICGTMLYRGRWFVGGPMSAFNPGGCYIDPPVHTECKDFALQVCPYLAAPHYGTRIEDRTLDPNEKTPILIDPTMIPGRPVCFVAVMARGMKIMPVKRSTPYVKPDQPYMRVEYWRNGELLPEAEGERLVEEDRAFWPAQLEDRRQDARFVHPKPQRTP